MNIHLINFTLPHPEVWMHMGLTTYGVDSFTWSYELKDNRKHCTAVVTAKSRSSAEDHLRKTFPELELETEYE